MLGGVLERRSDAEPGGWVALPDCGSERLATVLAIGPGRGRTIRVDPASLAAEGQPLVPGTYRIAVHSGRTGHAGDLPDVTRSPVFTVR